MGAVLKSAALLTLHFVEMELSSLRMVTKLTFLVVQSLLYKPRSGTDVLDTKLESGKQKQQINFDLELCGLTV